MDLTLAGMWKNFSTLTFPRGEHTVDPIQLRETRKAFYAGAAHALVTLRDGTDGMTDDEGADAMASILNEVSALFDKEVEDYESGKYR